MHFLVVDEYLGRKALQYPNVFQSLIGRQPLFGVPLEAGRHEARKVGVLLANHQLQWFT